jgi:hypothetical protein
VTQANLFAGGVAIEPPDGDKGREERGAHYTPDALALALCRTVRDYVDPAPARIFEPGCGGGAFLRGAHATWPTAELVGVDLLPACTGPGRVETGDLFAVYEPFDLVIGNPDFSIAEEVVRHCMKLVKPYGHVALLLLSSFEESRERVPFWKEYPLFLRQAIGAPRPCFRADGQTDMRPYALYVWRDGHAGTMYRGLPPMVWK